MVVFVPVSGKMKEILMCSQMGFISDKDNWNLEELVLEEIHYYFLFLLFPLLCD